MNSSIKDMVSDGRKVRFLRYVKGELFYETECGFEFIVPLDDTGDGIFLAEDKAIFFMRYIKKHMKMINQAREEAALQN